MALLSVHTALLSVNMALLNVYHSHVRHDALTCITQPIHTCDLTYPHVCHEFWVRLYVRHDSCARHSVAVFGGAADHVHITRGVARVRRFFLVHLYMTLLHATVKQHFSGPWITCTL